MRMVFYLRTEEGVVYPTIDIIDVFVEKYNLNLRPPQWILIFIIFKIWAPLFSESSLKLVRFSFLSQTTVGRSRIEIPQTASFADLKTEVTIFKALHEISCLADWVWILAHCKYSQMTNIPKRWQPLIPPVLHNSISSNIRSNIIILQKWRHDLHCQLRYSAGDCRLKLTKSSTAWRD